MVGMLTAKTGHLTGSYSRLYVPDPCERHIMNEQMKGWKNEQSIVMSSSINNTAM